MTLLGIDPAEIKCKQGENFDIFSHMRRLPVFRQITQMSDA